MYKHVEYKSSFIVTTGVNVKGMSLRVLRPANRR